MCICVTDVLSYPSHTSNREHDSWTTKSCILASSSGVLIGQAITIHEWEFRDGTRGGPIAEANVVDDRQTKATAEDVAQAG